MSTNYYAIKNRCEHCGREDRVHIGKSSGGWDFTFHAIPEQIENFEQFMKFIEAAKILDEYDVEVTRDFLLELIREKKKRYPFAHRLSAQKGYGKYVDGYYFVDGDFC